MNSIMDWTAKFIVEHLGVVYFFVGLMPVLCQCLSEVYIFLIFFLVVFMLDLYGCFVILKKKRGSIYGG